MRKQRALAILLSAMMCFLVLFSVFYVVVENNHDCSGENCPICYQINMCESTIKSISAGSAAPAVVAAAFVILLLMSLIENETNLNETLVSLKVKLSS